MIMSIPSSSMATPPTSLSSSNSLFSTALPKTRLAVSAQRRRNGALGCRCLFGLGVPELAVIAGVATLLFGPKKLPEIGRSIGKTIKGFQQAANEFQTELKKETESDPLMAESSTENARKEPDESGVKESL